MSGSITLSVDTPIGPLDVTLSRYAIQRIDFGGVAPKGPVPKPIQPLFSQFCLQLEEYFSGRRDVFDLALEPRPSGTDFQTIVWETLKDIPYGEVISYQDLAVWSGRPRATRAAGAACGANRIPILIPCHRVVGKATLGGYGGGLGIKKTLLKLERDRLLDKLIE